MEKIFGIEGVRILVGDVITYAETMAELVNRILKVFNRCRKYSPKLNRSKCEFGVRQISILGRVVPDKGIKPDPAKTKAIKATPTQKMCPTFGRFSERVDMLQNLFQIMLTSSNRFEISLGKRRNGHGELTKQRHSKP